MFDADPDEDFSHGDGAESACPIDPPQGSRARETPTMSDVSEWSNIVEESDLTKELARTLLLIAVRVRLHFLVVS